MGHLKGGGDDGSGWCPLTFTGVGRLVQRSPWTVCYWAARSWLVPVMIGTDGRCRYTEQAVLEDKAKASGRAA
jgi:hypothetical protein